MDDNKEQIKQMIAIELENARLWASFLMPIIGLAMAILFTEQYLVERLFAKVMVGLVSLYFTFFVIYKRNERLKRANELIFKL